MLSKLEVGSATQRAASVACQALKTRTQATGCDAPESGGWMVEKTQVTREENDEERRKFLRTISSFGSKHFHIHDKTDTFLLSTESRGALFCTLF